MVLRESTLPTERILQAAARMMAHAGADGTTMNEIAQGAGVSKATLYRRFRGREGLIEALREAGLYQCPGLTVARKEQILAAVLRALERIGLGGLTMSAVAAEAGVTPAALYWYFPGKEQLVDAALDHFCTIVQTEEIVSPDGEGDEIERISIFAERIMRVILSHARIFTTLMLEAQTHPEAADSIINKLLGRAVPILTKYLDNGVAQGTVRPGNNLARAEAFLSMLVMDALSRRALGARLSLEPKDAVQAYVDLFVNGIQVYNHHGRSPVTGTEG